ncbi:SgcJ/EcaC family oxidoreductase [uncultured Gimesia sp.]|uniref:YybH family protein n=1 Tax=uncultured Gimesia sp. TaxID=1678688 RepID=UPI00260555FE|nr:SgcJ/EcaC family oxidoreductase [uncultured Gimesia sp.]
MNLPQRKTCFGLSVPVFVFYIVLSSAPVYSQFQRTPQASGVGTEATKSQPAPKTSQLLQSIQKIELAFKAAFDQGNAKQVASFWAPEGEYIEAGGMRFVGSQAIEKAYQKYFKETKNAKIEISVDSVRQIGDNLAIEEGRTLVTVPKVAPDMSQYTATYVKQNGKWSMLSVKEYRLAPSASQSGLKDLEWLLGNWVTELKGVTLTTDYHWLPGKKFIERTYFSSRNGKPQVLGKQIIGVDPSSGDIMSWTFNTDGSHAVGIWAAVENGWLIESRGVTSDGMLTSAHNILSKIDKNGCRWQSVNRTANGIELPDALEVVSKRK